MYIFTFWEKRKEKVQKKSYLNSLTEFTEITPTGTLKYCFLSNFESKILINIGSLESLLKYVKRQSRLQQTTFIDIFSLFFRENKT